MQTTYGTSYEPRIARARDLLVSDPTIRTLLDPSLAPAVLERFLIQFSAQGVQITQPVDSWIRRAGERCIQIGLPEIGHSLVVHSKHEAGHHLMLIDDTRLLVSRWNDHHTLRLSAEELLVQPLTTAMRDYISLHEEIIASDVPFGQVAIELEIERMSTTFGPQLLAQCRSLLEPAALAGLSFITEHVALDVGHTALNQRLMDRLLQLRPDTAETLVSIGSRALEIYVRFFGECLRTATREQPVLA